MIDVNEKYGKMMLSSIENYIKHNIISENFVRTIKYVRETLYSIDQNPRVATLALHIEYNLPILKDHIMFLWENLNIFNKFESQLKNI